VGVGWSGFDTGVEGLLVTSMAAFVALRGRPLCARLTVARPSSFSGRQGGCRSFFWRDCASRVLCAGTMVNGCCVKSKPYDESGRWRQVLNDETNGNRFFLTDGSELVKQVQVNGIPNELLNG